MSFRTEKQCIDTLNYLVASSPSCYSYVMKRNVIPVPLIGKNAKARIVNTLFIVKLLALVEQLAALLKRDFLYAFFFLGGGRISRVTVLPSCCYIAQKMKFSTKDFFSHFGNCKLQTANLVTFTGEIVIGKPSFFVHW